MSRKRKKGSDRQAEESGVYLVIVALLGLVFVGLAALAIGLGFVASERSRLQVIGNLVAKAAIASYIRSDEEEEAPRREAAVATANVILRQNRLAGADSYLDGIELDQPGPGGTIRFGRYYPKKAQSCDTTTCPCGEDELDYPCFFEVDTGEFANAVRLNLMNENTNPIFRPFAGVFNPDVFQLNVEATTAVVETCTANLLDVSVSTTGTNHKPFDLLEGFCEFEHDGDEYAGCGLIPPSPPDRGFPKCGDVGYGYPGPLTCDDPPSLNIVSPHDALGRSRAGVFALDYTKIYHPNGRQRKCWRPDNWELDMGLYPDFYYWCNMEPSRPDAAGPIPDDMQFRSDYVQQMVFGSNKKMLVNLNVFDSDWRVQPMASFFLGFNAALRQIIGLKSDADQGIFMAFTGDVLGRVFPEVDEGQYVMTTDLGFLTQLTDMSLVGGVTGELTSNGIGIPDGEQVHPNFLDKGFFPMEPLQSLEDHVERGTNIVKALVDAADALSSSCSDTSRKMVFLATDGMGTCFFDFGDPQFLPDYPQQLECGENVPLVWDIYKIHEYLLLQHLIPLLQEREIAVTVMFGGEGVQPNYYNIEDPDGPGNCTANNDPNCFLSFDRAQALGIGGPPPPTGEAPFNLQPCPAPGTSEDHGFFNCASIPRQQVPWPMRDEQAFNELQWGVEGAIFGRATGVMGELAFATGGQYCMLMDVGSVSDYWDHDGDESNCQGIYSGMLEGTPCVLKNSARDFILEYRAYEYVSKPVQAVRCAQKAINLDPFISVLPDQVILD